MREMLYIKEKASNVRCLTCKFLIKDYENNQWYCKYPSCSFSEIHEDAFMIVKNCVCDDWRYMA